MRRLLPVLFSCLILAIHAYPKVGYCGYAVTADRQFVFVMMGGNDCLPASPYPRNGMYRNDGSLEPLWTIDWKGHLLLPSDGRHVVREGDPLGFEITRETPALTFYEDGKVVKIWRVDDLATFSVLYRGSGPYHGGVSVVDKFRSKSAETAGMALIYDAPPAEGRTGYPANGDVEFDDANGTMTLVTDLGDTFTFDYRSGEMLSSKRPSRLVAVGLAGAVAVFWLLTLLPLMFRRAGRLLRGVFCASTGLITAFLVVQVPIFTLWFCRRDLSWSNLYVRDWIFFSQDMMALMTRRLLIDLGIINGWTGYNIDQWTWQDWSCVYFLLPVATFIAVVTAAAGKRLRERFAAPR